MQAENGKGQYVKWSDVSAALMAIKDDFGIDTEVTFYLRRGIGGTVVQFWQVWAIGKGDNRVADALYRGAEAPTANSPSVPATLFGLALLLHDDIEAALRGSARSVTPIEAAIAAAPAVE